ncbi:MAG: outer membrane beta-barrel family protein, partial [Flavobacteriales bacterium]|nr:outer membrane beta-barrel family protein [Flavobacteriales bacterium]
KKALEGLNGTMGMNYTQKSYWSIAPWIKASFRKDRLSINAQYNYNNNQQLNEIEEVSDYFTTLAHQDSHSFSKSKSQNHYASMDMVYDLTPKSEIGLAVEYTNGHSNNPKNDGYTRQESPDGGLDVTSEMKDINNNNRVNVTAYYKIKTDEKGSSFKVVGDYTYNNTKGYNFSSALYDYDNGKIMSNIYDYSAPTTVDLFSVRSDYDHKSEGNITWSTGTKYSNSHIASQANYRTYDGLAWNDDDPRNNVFSYNEQVVAAYGKMNISLPKGWSAVAGLRMEYTLLTSYSLTMEQKDDQNYFDFFPQVSIMKSFGENKLHSISANYTRRLSRPSYSIFNPFVIPINEFSSVVGNPDIRPSYINRYGISGVLYGKYSISAEYAKTSGSVEQVTLIDPDNYNKTIYKHINMGNAYSWSLSASAPITITKWYGMNLNGTILYSEESMKDYTYYLSCVQGSMQNNFTFGKGWSADVSGWFTSLLRQGNLTVDPMWMVNASVVKKCINNRLVFSLNVNDVFGSMKNTIYSSGAQFEKKTISRWDAQSVTLGVRWNFAQGKNSKTKKVESGNSEDRNRL